MCSRGVFFNFLGEVVCEKNCQAVPMLMKAIECRVRERELFQSMRCQVACDMRIIGRDRENRPVIYLSARSQSEHLRELIPHVFLAFEVPTKNILFFGAGQKELDILCLFLFKERKYQHHRIRGANMTLIRGGKNGQLGHHSFSTPLGVPGMCVYIH